LDLLTNRRANALFYQGCVRATPGPPWSVTAGALTLLQIYDILDSHTWRLCDKARVVGQPQHAGNARYCSG